MECSELRKRYDRLVSQRKTVEDTWDLIERFVVPLRAKFFETTEQETAVDWRRRNIYDDTAITSCQSLAASIHGALTSPITPWFDLRFRTAELNEDQEAKAWLQECRSRIWYAIQESNFNLEVAELYIDLCSFGTGMFVEETLVDDDEELQELVFDAVPLKEGFFEQNHRGQAKAFYRRLMWEPSQIISKFGEENVPDSVIEKDKAGAQLDKIEVVYAIYERPEKINNPTDKPLAPKERPYGWKYFLHTDSHLLDEGGYYEMPVYIPRWRKTSASRWGHSPATICLSNILTINELVELVLEAGEKAIDPPMKAPERGLISDLDNRAGGLTICKDPDKLKELTSQGRFDVSALNYDQLAQGIRRTFHVDQLELKESPAMTATEVQVRYELMQRLLGPTLGRLQSDFLDPLITRTFRILYRTGRLPDLPESVQAADLDIEYLGPLSRAQKSDTAVSVERWAGSMAGLMEIFPDIRDIINIDKLARGTADMHGVPAEMLNSQAVVNRIRKQRQELEAAQAAIVAAQQSGEAMQALGAGAEAMQ